MWDAANVDNGRSPEVASGLQGPASVCSTQLADDPKALRDQVQQLHDLLRLRNAENCRLYRALEVADFGRSLECARIAQLEAQVWSQDKYIKHMMALARDQDAHIDYLQAELGEGHSTVPSERTPGPASTSGTLFTAPSTPNWKYISCDTLVQASEFLRDGRDGLVALPVRLPEVLVPVADDSEEIETACITDTLVRAGAVVTVASVTGHETVRMSRGLKIVADCLIEHCTGKEWDAIVCPGGMPGAERLRDSAPLAELLKAQSAAAKVTAAVCASPAVVFGAHGLLPGKAVCYPAPKFTEILGDKLLEGVPVAHDGHIITGTGPGTSLQFALKVVEALYGRAKAEDVAKAMLTTCA